MRWTAYQDELVKRIAIQIQYAYRPQVSPFTYASPPAEPISFLAGLSQHPEGGYVLLDATDALLGFPEILDMVRLHHRDGVGWSARPAWEELAQILDDGRSARRVGRDHEHLVRRVDDAVQQVADAAPAHTAESAGGHLMSAWNAVHGRQPDPDRGYDEAVRAVEAAVPPVAIPKDARPSPGKAIAHLKSTQASWQVAGAAPIDAILTELEQLRTRHPRHAAQARQVQQGEAEAAVHTAAHVVHLFGRGLVSRTAARMATRSSTASSRSSRSLTAPARTLRTSEPRIVSGYLAGLVVECFRPYRRRRCARQSISSKWWNGIQAKRLPSARTSSGGSE